MAGTDVVPEELAFVYPVGEHQIVVFQDCRGEYCVERFHLRKVELNGVFETVCKTPIAEFNTRSGWILERVDAVVGADTLRLDVRPAGSQRPVVVRYLTVSGSCKYRLR